MYRKNLDAAFLAAASTPSGANPLITATEQPLEEVANVVKLKTGFGTNGFTVGTESTEIAKTVTGGGLDSYTKLLLHMDDAGLTDATGKDVTPVGNVALDTGEKQFGAGSAVFDGTGDALTVLDSADFAFGNGDFTIDTWIRPTALGNAVFGQWGGARTQYSVFMQNTGGNYVLYYGTGGTGQQVAFSVAGSYAPVNTWTHIAIVRNGTTLKGYFGGVERGTYAIGTGSINDGNGTFNIGSMDGSSVVFNGRIDEFRISKGIARWTSDFSSNLPASPYAAGFTSTDFVSSGSVSFAPASLKVTIDGTERVANVSGDLTAMDLVFTGANGSGIQYSFNADGISDFVPATPLTATAFAALAASTFYLKTHLFLKFIQIAAEVITAPKLSTQSTSTVTTKADGFSVQLNSVKVFEAQADGDVIAADIRAKNIYATGNLIVDDTNAAGVTPVASDVTDWENGGSGIVIGTTGRRFHVIKKDADEIFVVELGAI